NNFANALPDNANAHALEGYAEVSLFPGDMLHLHVSDAANQTYRVLLYRLGWYGGTGARLIACLPSCTTSKQGQAWPIPSPDPTTGYLNANWPVTDSYTLSAGAVSGYYIAKLLVTSGALNGKWTNVPFVVKAPPGQNAAILVQAPVNTWQAYNPWGGKSLYNFNSTHTHQAYKVSFNRPYAVSREMFF